MRPRHRQAKLAELAQLWLVAAFPKLALRFLKARALGEGSRLTAIDASRPQCAQGIGKPSWQSSPNSSSEVSVVYAYRDPLLLEGAAEAKRPCQQSAAPTVPIQSFAAKAPSKRSRVYSSASISLRVKVLLVDTPNARTKPCAVPLLSATGQIDTCFDGTTPLATK